MNALVPQGKPRRGKALKEKESEQDKQTAPSDRRRLLGFLLLLLAVFILLPEFQFSKQPDGHSPAEPALQAWSSPTTDQQLEAMLETEGGIDPDLPAQRVPIQTIEDTKSWSSQYQPRAPEPAYMVQVGTFKRVDNAAQLMEKLKKLGYPAFTREEQGLTKVMVGPQLREKEAKSTMKDVSNALALQGFVRNYLP